MADTYWSGLGVADGTTINSGNINTAGNSDVSGTSNTVAFASSGTFTAVYSRQANPIGPGASITAANTSSVARLDLGVPASRAVAVQLIYTPSANPVTAEQTVIATRTASAFTSQVGHLTTGELRFRNATGAELNSAGAGAGATTAALTAGHSYRIDLVVAQNTGTRSSANGRFICRVISLSSSTWNTTGEFFLDVGYTDDAGTADQTIIRVGKTSSGSNMAQAYYTGIRWGDRPSINTSSDPTIARTQFISITSFSTLRPAVAAYRHLLVR